MIQNVFSCRYILPVLVCTLAGLSCSSGQFECPQQPVTRNPDGTLTYSPFPPGTDSLDTSYNPGAIGGWYSLASGFVDLIRPGSLPYGKCSKLCVVFLV